MAYKNAAEKQAVEQAVDAIYGDSPRRPEWLIALRRWLGLARVDLDKINRESNERLARRLLSPEYKAEREAPFQPGGAYYHLKQAAERSAAARAAKEAAGANGGGK